MFVVICSDIRNRVPVMHYNVSYLVFYPILDPALFVYQLLGTDVWVFFSFLFLSPRIAKKTILQTCILYIHQNVCAQVEVLLVQ